MGTRKPFGRPGLPDRLSAWWYAKAKPTRGTMLLWLAVGAVAVGLVAAALAQDGSRPSGLVNATRPQLGDPLRVNPPSTVDVRAAGELASPLAPLDRSSSSTTSTTVAAGPAPPRASTPPPSAAGTMVTTTVRPVVTTVATSDVIYTQVPGPRPPPTTTTSAALPATTTTVPASSPPASSTSTSTTAVPLLAPLPLDVPRLP